MNSKNNWHQFQNDYSKEFWESIQTIDPSDIDNLVNIILNVEKSQGKIIVAGNGGSAAIASHVAVDFTKAAGINSVCYSDSSLITCFANDYGYEHWLENAIKFYAQKQDLIILISSSGNSLNMINAATIAKEKELPLVTLTGFSPNNSLRNRGDVNFWVNSKSYNIVEMTHQYWLLSIMDFIIFQKSKND